MRLWYVHHSVAHTEEVLPHQWLSEEVGDVLGRRHEGNTEATVFYAFTNEIMTAVDMLRARVVLGVIRQVDSRFIVHSERRRLGHVETEFP